ncbi:MAG: hypothetical protein ABIJ57_15155 [Pseudomonadota bacterium]|nr:hypothetical protein [Pseudomonadota bacterium]MBU4121638.1 hypothetical protein [Pseudomonadota bacterium]
MVRRLLAILDPQPDGDAMFRYCLAEAIRGNWKPIEEYKRRGGKIPHVEKPNRPGQKQGIRKPTGRSL